MNRLPARLFPACLSAAALALAAPLAAQQQSGTFTLPEPTPTPTPAPAGPADERAGVAIPPRAAPSAAPSPVILPLPSPSAARSPSPSPRDILTPSPSAAPRPAPQASPSAPAPAATPSDSATGDPLTLPPAVSQVAPAAPATSPSVAVGEPLFDLADWWPLVASALAAIAALGGLAAWQRRRKPKVARLAPPVDARDTAAPASIDDAPRLDLTLEIISATRSVMMFTVQYRLNIANRSDRAVTDLAAAVQLACARASAGAAPSARAAQATSGIARVGPQQARSVTGTVQLPLSAIAPLRQGQTPMFVPLVHVTLEGESLPAQARTFVIGTPSPSGRVHPILLDASPGGIAGLVAQAVSLPPASAAA
ncbi:hypothetical protein [uncultured Erythrobacter sp.]|uniref:hypothetical protein n=1 Tax=uncultured Erythrobacter sp. TaxID=263913 RepID=UPI002657F200|nr:hypothetical protein [uncultured Erythrobacter sp.]